MKGIPYPLESILCDEAQARTGPRDASLGTNVGIPVRHEDIRTECLPTKNNSRWVFTHCINLGFWPHF